MRLCLLQLFFQTPVLRLQRLHTVVPILEVVTATPLSLTLGTRHRSIQARLFQMGQQLIQAIDIFAAAVGRTHEIGHFALPQLVVFFVFVFEDFFTLVAVELQFLDGVHGEAGHFFRFIILLAHGALGAVLQPLIDTGLAVYDLAGGTLS